MGKMFKNEGISLVTAQDPFEIGLIGYLAVRRLKAKLQLQIHTDFLSPYFIDSFKNRIRMWLAKRLLPKADSIRVVSERIKRSLIGLGLPEEKIMVLPISYDEEKIKSEPVTIDLHKKYQQFNFIILMASRLEREKNIEMAIDAMVDMVKSNQMVGLIIAGDGSLKEELQKRVSKNNLENNVIFEGWVKDLSSYYKTADVLWNTSNYEGYGRATRMANVSGTSVVTTDVGLAGDVLNNNDCFVIAVGDKQLLVDSTLKLMADKPLREEFAKRAQQSALSLVMTKEEYLQKYKQSWEMALL